MPLHLSDEKTDLQGAPAHDHVTVNTWRVRSWDPGLRAPQPGSPPVSAEDWTSQESSRAPVLLLHLLTIRHGSSHFILLRLTFIFYKPDPDPLQLAYLSGGQGCTRE